MESATESIRQKIESLTPEQLATVDDLITALQNEKHTRTMLSLSEPAFAAVWDDPENDIYDTL